MVAEHAMGDRGCGTSDCSDVAEMPSYILLHNLATMLWHTHTHGALMPHLFPDIFIPASAVLGIIFALFLWYRVSLIRVRSGQRQTGEDGRTFLLEEELTGEDSVGCMALVLKSRVRERSRLQVGGAP